jgi:hypothetical protein
MELRARASMLAQNKPGARSLSTTLRPRMHRNLLRQGFGVSGAAYNAADLRRCERSNVSNNTGGLLIPLFLIGSVALGKRIYYGAQPEEIIRQTALPPVPSTTRLIDTQSVGDMLGAVPEEKETRAASRYETVVAKSASA